MNEDYIRGWNETGKQIVFMAKLLERIKSLSINLHCGRVGCDTQKVLLKIENTHGHTEHNSRARFGRKD